MQPIRIAINGFGRIGRRLFRLCLDQPDIEVVAVNDIADIDTLAHLLRYDSVHGLLHREVTVEDGQLLVDDLRVRFSSFPDIADLKWPEADIVVECTGKFKRRDELDKHLQAGAHKVLLSVPPDDHSIPMVVLGVNEHQLDPEWTIVSNASCTTNNAAPMLKVIDRLCGIQQAYITTVHSYTTDQSVHDQPHRDLRRARAASQSIIPTTTGAAKALTHIFPQYADVIGGCGIRVPVPDGSLTDMTVNVHSNVDAETVNRAFKEAAEGELKGILQYTSDPIVSVDVIGNTHSCVFDSSMTSVIGQMVKLIGWYDNETGYSARIIDCLRRLSRK
jgi:glyceraldehyde 3-phosphate dehydrogenase